MFIVSQVNDTIELVITIKVTSMKIAYLIESKKIHLGFSEIKSFGITFYFCGIWQFLVLIIESAQT